MTVSHKTPTKSFWYWGQILAALVGIGLSLYLLVQHTRLKSGIQGAASFCSLGKYADCDVVNVSPYAEFLGLPIAGIGALYFFLLLVLGLVAPPGDRSFTRVQRWMAWLNGMALMVDLGLMLVQVVALRNGCLLCFLTYVATAFHLFCNLRMNARWGERPSRILRAALFEGSHAAPAFPRLALGSLGIAAFLAVIAMIPSFVRKGSETYAHADEALTQFYEQWKTLPSRAIPTKEGDGTMGNAGARVKVVVFSDFECPYCRKAAFTMHTALAPFKDQVFLVFKHYPLDSTCNPALQYQLHPQACALARLAYCADRKGRFWEYHDRVFMGLTDADIQKGKDAIAENLKDLFSTAELTACLSDAEALANLTQDIRLGDKLGVKGTPTVFINGKPVTIPLTVETVRKLLELESSRGS